jgi:hypothetical protein
MASKEVFGWDPSLYISTHLSQTSLLADNACFLEHESLPRSEKFANQVEAVSHLTKRLPRRSPNDGSKIITEDVLLVEFELGVRQRVSLCRYPVRKQLDLAILV